MALFGKKKEAKPGVTGVPIDRVLQMKQQGIVNTQIIDTLRGEGYSDAQVFDALSQADIKSAVGGEQPGQPGDMAPPPGQAPMLEGQMPAPAEAQMPPAAAPMPPMPEGQQMPPPNVPPAAPPEMPPPGPAPMPGSMPPPPGQMQAPSAPMAGGKEEIEAVAESIIDEKWETLMKGMDKIVAWKDEAEGRLVKMEQQISDLKERFEELHKGILAKIGDYDKNIKAVGSDIKAMETVFKKTLPTFTENISELSRITKGMKKKKKTV